MNAEVRERQPSVNENNYDGNGASRDYLLSIMGCHALKTPDGKVNGIITLADIYEFEGFVFEFHCYLGPCKLRKSDWEPAARMGPKFFAMLDRWLALSDEQKEETRIFG